MEQYGSRRPEQSGEVQLPPQETISDVARQAVSGLAELRNGLEHIANRLSGSVPQINGNADKEREVTFMDEIQSIRALVTMCHSEMARIQRVL